MAKPELPPDQRKRRVTVTLRIEVHELMKASGNASDFAEKAVLHYEKYLRRKKKADSN